MKKCLAFVCIVCLIAGCSTIPITMRRQLSFVPQAQLLSLGETNFNEIMKTAVVSQSAINTAMVERVGTRVAASAEKFLRENGQASDIQNYRWDFALIADSKVNAFCLPGGKVVVYTGILPMARDEAGLAVVIGHEVAHALANHGGERMSQQLLVQMGTQKIADAVNKNPTRARALLLQAFGAGAKYGVLLPYSRLHEREADRIGMILMADAGYDPNTAVAFWQRMQAASKDRTCEFLSTHPAPATRIQELQAGVPEALGYYRGQKIEDR